MVVNCWTGVQYYVQNQFYLYVICRYAVCIYHWIDEARPECGHSIPFTSTINKLLLSEMDAQFNLYKM